MLGVIFKKFYIKFPFDSYIIICISEFETKNTRSIFRYSFLIEKRKRMFRYHLFLCFINFNTSFSYLYNDFLEFFFSLINFHYFLIKSHKLDLFSLINKLAGNFRKKRMFTALKFCMFSVNIYNILSSQ